MRCTCSCARLLSLRRRFWRRLLDRRARYSSRLEKSMGTWARAWPSTRMKPASARACASARAWALSASGSSGESWGRSLTMVSMRRPARARSAAACRAAGMPMGSTAYSLTVVPTKSVDRRSRRDSQPPPGNDKRRALSASSAVVRRSKGAVKAGAGQSCSSAKPSGGWAANCASRPGGSSWLCRRSAGIAPSGRLGFREQLVQQDHGFVDLGARDHQRGREGDHVLVVAAHVQHQAAFLALVFQAAFEADVHHLVQQRLVGREAVFGADLGAQRQAQAVHVADFLVALLQLLRSEEHTSELQSPCNL